MWGPNWHPVRVLSFFYGSYMDPEVLGRFGAEASNPIPATVAGQRLAFSPHANLLPDDGATAHGFLFSLTHEELDKLYGPNGFVTTYRPVAVMAKTDDGVVPAMTFVENAPEATPDPAYLESFLAICTRLGLPSDYVAGIKQAAAQAAST